MMRRCFQTIGGLACLLALLGACGGQWLALQTVAWTTMLIEYSQRAPLGEAIRMTFDEKHPCALCSQVRKGRQQEQQSPRKALHWTKLPEVVPQGGCVVPLPPTASREAVPCVAVLIAAGHPAPPKPVPRDA